MTLDDVSFTPYDGAPTFKTKLTIHRIQSKVDRSTFLMAHAVPNDGVDWVLSSRWLEMQQQQQSQQQKLQRSASAAGLAQPEM